MIKALYSIERGIKELPDAERKKQRQEKSKPILEKLKAYAEKTKAKVLPKSKAGTAFQYFLGQYERMKNYLEKPEADIDNNYCENALRPITIGRKNYLFAGSHEGARRAAIIYTLVLTCRVHEISPFQYFMKLFEVVDDSKNHKFVDLLPGRINL